MPVEGGNLAGSVGDARLLVRVEVVRSEPEASAALVVRSGRLGSAVDCLYDFDVYNDSGERSPA